MEPSPKIYNQFSGNRHACANGAYNRSSCVQATGSSAAVPLFEKAASLVQLPSAAGPVVIADYGSSEGHNSLEPLTAAIAVLRRRIGPERAIWVVHTGLPGNEWKNSGISP